MSKEFITGYTNQELRAASTASGGTALSTTAAFIPLPLGSKYIYITPRNLSTAVVARVALNPWLVVLKTTDAMATAPTDYSSEAQDGDAATHVVLSSLDTLANGDFLLIGSHLPFRGVWCDVDGSNAAGDSTTTAIHYFSGPWTALSVTDGTDTGRPFAQDGLVYWTMPTAGLWLEGKLKDMYPNCTSTAYYMTQALYWTRWTVDAALENSVTLDQMLAANRSTAYAELASGQVYPEKIVHGIGGIGCVEALTDAGTANLVVNVGPGPGGRFS